MECKCETCVRKDCAERTKQDDLRMVIACSDYLNTERQMTNADRIRAMTDEELARMFTHIEYATAKEVFVQFGVDITHFDYDADAAAKEFLKQLQQPAEGDA